MTVAAPEAAVEGWEGEVEARGRVAAAGRELEVEAKVAAKALGDWGAAVVEAMAVWEKGAGARAAGGVARAAEA